MRWTLDYRQFQALYCTAAAHENTSEHYRCGRGVMHDLLYPPEAKSGGDSRLGGRPLLKKLLKRNNVLRLIADIANQCCPAEDGKCRIDREQWRGVKVQFRNFKNVMIPQGSWGGTTREIPRNEMIITPKIIYLPWPLPFARLEERENLEARLRDAIEDYDELIAEYLRPLEQSDLYSPTASPTGDDLNKEYLLYNAHLVPLSFFTHPTAYDLSDNQIRRYVQEPKAFLGQYFKVPLPQHLAVKANRDTWDFTITSPRRARNGVRWKLRLRGPNAFSPNDDMMLIKVPEITSTNGLKLTELVTRPNDRELTICVPDEWYDMGVRIEDLIYDRDSMLTRRSDDNITLAEAADCSLLCWSQCPDCS